jgi:hypothetical protein
VAGFRFAENQRRIFERFWQARASTNLHPAGGPNLWVTAEWTLLTGLEPPLVHRGGFEVGWRRGLIEGRLHSAAIRAAIRDILLNHAQLWEALRAKAGAGPQSSS